MSQIQGNLASMSGKGIALYLEKQALAIVQSNEMLASDALTEASIASINQSVEKVDYDFFKSGRAAGGASTERAQMQLEEEIKDAGLECLSKRYNLQRKDAFALYDMIFRNEGENLELPAPRSIF